MYDNPPVLPYKSRLTPAARQQRRNQTAYESFLLLGFSFTVLFWVVVRTAQDPFRNAYPRVFPSTAVTFKHIRNSLKALPGSHCESSVSLSIAVTSQFSARRSIWPGCLLRDNNTFQYFPIHSVPEHTRALKALSAQADRLL